MKLTLIFLILSAAMIACNHSSKPDDPEKLKAVLLNYFDGISTHDIQKLNARRSVDWVESATFRKLDGEWKIDFLHSTVKR
jgi:hypothetical protein